MRRISLALVILVAGMLTACDFTVDKPEFEKCTTDDDCAPGYCDTGSGECFACLDDAHCPSGKHCHPELHQCVACFADDHCLLGVCDEDKYYCTECLEDKDCASGKCDEEKHICIECGSDDECDDGNPCTKETCVEGQCASVPATGEIACSDGDPCTLGDTCVEGACVPGQKDPECIEPPDGCKEAEDGTPCDDGDACTLDDYCLKGECVGDSIAPECQEEDLDGDGFTVKEGDCNDKDPAIHPGAIELCDGKDNDCDGEIDEGCGGECIVTGCSGQVCAAEPVATDCEWKPEYECFKLAKCGPFGSDGQCAWLETPEYLECLEGICVPKPEVCDGKDNDCDGVVDEDCGEVCGGIAGLPCPQGHYCQYDPGTCDWADMMGVCVKIPLGCPDVWAPVCGCDGKTYGNACDMAAAHMSMDYEGECKENDKDGDGYPVDKDCDDTDASVHPFAPELCDGKDNDCDGEVDEGCGLECGGFISIPCPEGSYCQFPEGTCDWADQLGTCVEIPWACPDVWMPVCACNGKTYGNECELAAAGQSMDHEGECKDPMDKDGDGYPADQDCDDLNPMVHPGAPELCNGMDDDCDGQVDEGCNECKEACDCYDLYGFDFAEPCPMMCPTCDNYWSCEQGKCVEKCGPVPPEVSDCYAACIPEGEGFLGQPEEFQCCPGLVAVADCEEMPCDPTSPDCDDFYCSCPKCLCFVCVACGDGICGLGENKCNCPKDCLPAPACTSNSDCDDGDACTEDICKEGLCVHNVLPDCGICWDDAMCPAGSYCRYPDGQCDNAKSGSCAAIPEACFLLWKPVCGCDGVTYGNECQLQMAMQSLAYEGECEAQPQQCGGIAGLPCPAGHYCKYPAGTCDWADMMGECVPVPQVCPDVWKPVCGCNGKTYGNECEMAAAMVSMDHEGECKPETQPCGGIMGLGCPAGQYCQFPVGTCDWADMLGECVDVPWGCPDVWDPVCGCDGVTYSNACDMAAAQMSMDHEGACKSECVPLKDGNYGMCLALLGVVFDGEKCTWISGCSCEPDCKYFFDTLDECQAACL